MDFFTETAAPRMEGRIFHYRRPGALVFWLLLGACALLLVAVGAAGGITLTREMVPARLNEIAPFIAEAIPPSRGFAIQRTPSLFVGGFLLLFWRFLKTPILGGFGPSGWLMRTGREGILLKFRSYMNASFPPEDQVVALIPWHEIEWARRFKEHFSYRSPGRKGGTTHEFTTGLELKLNSRDLETLSRHLKRERTRKSPRGAAWRHYPVRLDQEGHLRVRWTARPKVAEALKALRGKVAVRESFRMRTRLEQAEAATPEAAEQVILRLLEEGNRFAALAAARKAYGMSLSDARRFVDQLAQNGPPGAPTSARDADQAHHRI